MKKEYYNSSLFMGMKESEIEDCLKCSHARIVERTKGSFVFDETTNPEKLYMLVSGEVSVGRYTSAGNKIIVTTFQEPGELFGEVFLFLPQNRYDYYAELKETSKVMEIPKSFFYQRCEQGCGHHDKLINNMFSILAGKAYFLNKKMEILSGSGLRQKIARFVEQKSQGKAEVKLNMKREELADFLGTTRPSLSRELMNMQQEGILLVKKDLITVLNTEYLEELI